MKVGKETKDLGARREDGTDEDMEVKDTEFAH